VPPAEAPITTINLPFAINNLVLKMMPSKKALSQLYPSVFNESDAIMGRKDIACMSLEDLEK
jgi:hypothetical protein